jgi:hypothetical protein
MHLHQLLGWRGPMTHRQFVTWRAWLEMQWNRPTKDDWYSMQIACEVSRITAKNKKKPRPKHFQLEFSDPNAKVYESASEEVREHISNLALAQWVARVGGRVTGIEKSGLKMTQGLVDKGLAPQGPPDAETMHRRRGEDDALPPTRLKAPGEA